MTLRRLDLTLPHPAENLALDEALLIAAEERGEGEVLRLWELPSPAVVVGAGGGVAADVNVSACETDRVPILRRASGGGTVLLGPGCLCFSLILAYERAAGLDQIPFSNRHVLGRILSAIRFVAPASLEGTSDLALAGSLLKFSGNAQQRKRRHFLHHGTILYGFDLNLISRYLNVPDRQPDYRRGRSHRDFVVNLGVNVGELKALLFREWESAEEYTHIPWDIVNKLVEEKYARDDWNRRR